MLLLLLLLLLSPLPVFCNRSCKHVQQQQGASLVLLLRLQLRQVQLLQEILQVLWGAASLADHGSCSCMLLLLHVHVSCMQHCCWWCCSCSWCGCNLCAAAVLLWLLVS
jgi:hypothetical protein